MVSKRLDPCEQLIAERLDAIRGIRRALVNPLEALFLLRKPTIDALEPLQDLGAHLLQPQHALSSLVTAMIRDDPRLATAMPARNCQMNGRRVHRCCRN